MEKDALDYALAHDCVIVASSGNESSSNGVAQVDFPAAYPPVIAVGASDPNDQRVFYSNGGAELDLLAPGGTGTAFSGNALTDSASKIFSSFLCPLSAAAVSEGGFEVLASDTNFGVAAGTSASAPFVTGAAALIRSVYPSLTHVQVEQAILNNADSLNGNQGWDAKTGYGRLNVYKALLNAGSGTGQLSSYLKTFNSPNPFYTDSDVSTNITLALDQAMPVDLSIYDSAGELVLRKSYGAADLNQNPSRPQFKSFYVPWDGKNGNGQAVTTGIYFYFVTVGGRTGHNKIAVIRGSK
jgi:subtilisin family serine protease